MKIVLGTPWWAFLLLAYFIWIGIKARNPGTVSLRKRVILPVILTGWTLTSLFQNHGAEAESVIVWGICMCIGIGTGWIITRPVELKADKKKVLIKTEGGWLTLILLILIFGVKYFFGYTYATNPLAKENPTYYVPDLAFSGIVAGFFLGRLLCFIKKYFKAHHTDL